MLLSSVTDILTEIKLCKTSIKYVLIVEGSLDKQLISSFTLMHNIITIIPANGKENVIDLHSKLPLLSEGNIFFFMDRDFDFFLNKNIVCDSVIYTEYYSIEIDIVFSNSFNKWYSIYRSPNTRVTVDVLLDKIVNECSKIGVFQYYSQCEALNISFKDLKWNRFLDMQTGDIDFKNLINYIFSKNNLNSLVKTHEQRIIDMHSRMDYLDRKKYLVGHQVCLFLNECSKKMFSTNTTAVVSEENRIERMLFLAYERDDFYLSPIGILIRNIA